MANVIEEKQASSERNRMSYKRIIRIVVIAFVAVFLLGGIVFSQQKGFYYPIFQKDCYDKSYYVLMDHKKCDVSWNVTDARVRNSVNSLKKEEEQYANSSYKRIANSIIINNGQQIGFGFWGLTIIVEPKEQTGNYVTWFYKSGDKLNKAKLWKSK